MVVTRNLSRLEREEEEEAIQLAIALAQSETQPLPPSDEDINILDPHEMQEEEQYQEMLNSPDRVEWLDRLREVAARHTQAHTAEVARLGRVREKCRQDDRNLGVWHELNLASQSVEYMAELRRSMAQLERCTELGYIEGVARSRYLTYVHALSEIQEIHQKKMPVYCAVYKTYARQRNRLKQLAGKAEKGLAEAIQELHRAENLYSGTLGSLDWIARRHPGLLFLPLTSMQVPERLNPFAPFSAVRPASANFGDIRIDSEEEETKDGDDDEPIVVETPRTPPHVVARTELQNSFLSVDSSSPSSGEANSPPIRKFRRLKRGPQGVPSPPKSAKIIRANSPPSPPSPTTTVASVAPSVAPSVASSRRSSKLSGPRQRSSSVGQDGTISVVLIGPRKDGHVTLCPADSDEEPFDPFEANLDRRGSMQQDPGRLPSHTLDRSLEDLGNRYQSLVVAANPPGFPQDFARSMVNTVSLLGSVLRTIVNTQPNVRRPVVMSAAEVRETHAKLARIVNDYVAPPQHSPADGRLCLGRMSDGSKCQLLADRCYLRAEGVHISTPGQVPRCFGRSIKPGLNRRCHHKWPRCQIHNPKYHEIFSSYHGHVHRSTGLVSSRSALLYDIEKDYGNREHDVIQGGRRVAFQGPQFPTAHSFSRHLRRLQEFDTLLESLNDPDIDAQGPTGPPDQHPGPQGPRGSHNPPGPPPMSAGGPNAISV